MINGSFSGELDLPNADNTEINNRVDQLEKEVKGRDAEIRDLNDRVTTQMIFFGRKKNTTNFRLM